MPIAPGTKLGPYSILSPLGAGGMGEVYRAHDQRLDRDVAIKVLPASFTGDPDRLRRFEQEARAIAALNHPNILSVHDIGQQNGVHYIVTELLEGRTLREVLMDGPVPVRKTLHIFQQIASGLAAAHDRGIIHRDLKPDNIFVSRDGQVKILDFGLAKQSPTFSSDGFTESPTISGPLTQSGMIMGTAGYMSPEQVRGGIVDHRSDVFALGAILYEMLSGRRAFKRDTNAETMTAILKEDPPELTATNPALVPGLDRIVRRCLEKEPVQRFQSVADLGFAIGSLSGATATNAPVPAAPPTKRLNWYPLAALGAVLGALATGWFAHSALGPRSPVPDFRRLTFERGTVYSARFSSDEKTVLYSAAWDGGPVEIYAASKEYPESRSLLKNAVLLSMSPDSDMALLTSPLPVDHYEYIGTLATMPVGGGAPRELLKDVTAADWAPDGRAMAVVHVVAGKYRLEYPEGTVRFETTGTITQPRVSRDGKSVAFLHHPHPGDDRGMVMLVDQSGKPKSLSMYWGAIQGLAWTPTGEELLFSAVDSGNDFALYALTLAGKRRRIFLGAGGLRMFDIGADGRVLASHSEIKYQINVSVHGGPLHDVSWLNNSFQPSLSRDAKQVVFSDGSEPTSQYYDVCLRNAGENSPVVHLGEGLTYDLSPDGAWAWTLILKKPPMVEILPTGPGQIQRPESSDIENYVGMGWLPDGRQFLFSGNELGHGTRIYIQSNTGGKARPVTREGFSSGVNLPVSPDGKQFIALDEREKAWKICAVSDGSCTPLPGSESFDTPLTWGSNPSFVYIGRSTPTPGIWRLEIATGRRQLAQEIKLADPVGVNIIIPASVTPDGDSSAIYFTRRLDVLYLATGLN